MTSDIQLEKTAATKGNERRCDRLGLFLAVAVMSAIASFLVRESFDADTWWQVAIGRDILGHLAVPRVDHFAAAAAGRSYHDSHWLFQLLLAAADRVGGMSGVGLVMVGFWSATFTSCYLAVRRWVTIDVAVVLVFFSAMACSDRFIPRPDIVTCLMISLFYFRLQEGRYRSFLDLALFALLQIIWSNSHGLFVIGPFMAGCYLLAAICRLPGGRGSKAELRHTARLVILLLFATLLTPFGLEGWKYAFLLMKEAGPTAPGLFKILAEFTPTFSSESLRNPDFWGFSVILLLFLLATAPLLVKRKVSATRLLIVMVMAFVAAGARRNMPLFALTATPLIAENLSLCVSRPRLPSLVKVMAALVMMTLTYFPLSGRYYQYIGYPLRFGLGTSPSFFPHPLPALLRQAGFQGQIYNSNVLGGFCLYHGFRPLFDGRWEVYDEKTLREIIRAPSNPTAFERLVSSYNITGMMLLHESPEANDLLPRLHADPRWRLVYLDAAASFWIRATDASRFALPSPPLQPKRSEEYFMLATFYQLTGEPEKVFPLLDRALALGEKLEKVLEKRGRALEDLKRYGEAESTFRLLLAEDSRNLAALNELAFLAYQRDDVEEAASLLRRALALKPNDAVIRANYEKVLGAGGAGQGGR